MAMEQRTRRRPLTRQEQLVLQERKQLRREKMEQSRELAKGPIDLPFCLLVLLLTAIGLCDSAFGQLSLRLLRGKSLQAQSYVLL